MVENTRAEAPLLGDSVVEPPLIDDALPNGPTTTSLAGAPTAGLSSSMPMVSSSLAGCDCCHY